MNTSNLLEQCEKALQTIHTRRCAKLHFLIQNRTALSKRHKKIDSLPVLLRLSRLSDREEQMPEDEFAASHFTISEGKIRSAISASALIKVRVWRGEKRGERNQWVAGI